MPPNSDQERYSPITMTPEVYQRACEPLHNQRLGYDVCPLSDLGDKSRPFNNRE